jgi:geranylgeranyl pyrophosphate synthase
MTSPSVSSELYGPVRDDVVKVDDLIASLRPKDFPFLSNILDHVLEAGGKRVRPAVALLAGRLGKYDLDLLIPLAASIELVHSASLVHDDVIDAAATRRGRATANALFNNAATVMVGDYMFANAADLVARTGNVDVVRLFARTLMEMTTGELQQDMSAYEYGQDTRKYFDRIYGKTASLFAAAAQGGAMVAGLPEGQCLALRSYGENVGMAFQIMDDILDFTADAAELGKPAGSDLMNGTLTLPALLLIERDPEGNPVKRFFEGGRGKQENLRRALKQIRESDILEESLRVAHDFRDKALASLATVGSGEDAAVESLTDVAYWVAQRRS